MSPVAIGVMVVSAIGMFFGLSKQKAGVSWGKPVATVCAIVALGCAVSQIFSSKGPSMMKIREREMAYQMIGAQKLGMYLAEKFSGSKAVIIVEPQLGAVDPDSAASAQVEGLKEGFGGSIEVVAEISPTIPDSAKNAFSNEMAPMAEGEGGPEGGEMLPPLEFWFTGKLFDQLVTDNKDKCNLIITTIGLPMDLGAMKFWKMKDRPKLALASGSVYELKAAIKQQMVVAAVTYNPKAVYDEKAPPSNLDAAFDKRFLLVTSENVDEVAGAHKDLFK